MAKRTKSSKGPAPVTGLILIVSSILFCFFLFYSYYSYKKLKIKHNLSNADIRVYDSWQVFDYFAAGTGVLVIPSIIILLVFVCVSTPADTVHHVKNTPIIVEIFFTIFIFLIVMITFLFFIAFGIAMAGRLATTYIGVLFFLNEDKFVLPMDTHNNSLSENLIYQKWFFDYLKMEELKISSVKKITRDKGKNLFIHGDFGTRSIAYNDKQKRDECIAAFERARGKRLSSFDLGY